MTEKLETKKNIKPDDKSADTTCTFPCRECEKKFNCKDVCHWVKEKIST